MASARLEGGGPLAIHTHTRASLVGFATYRSSRRLQRTDFGPVITKAWSGSVIVVFPAIFRSGVVFNHTSTTLKVTYRWFNACARFNAAFLGDSDA